MARRLQASDSTPRYGPVPPAVPTASPTAYPTVLARRKSAVATPAKRGAKPKAMTSSERGLKFRKKQQERQLMLQASTEDLRREIARLEALRTLHQSRAVVGTSTECSSTPMRFTLEYFAQFRHGVRDSLTTTSPAQQETFLSNMIEPGTCFFGKPAIQAIMDGLRQKAAAHSAMRMERTASHLVTIEGCATVVSHGVTHLRYSRRTIEMLYPHVLHNEELVRKLVGRQLHVPFTSKMFFNARGRLVNIEIEPDFFSALYEVLHDLRECEELLGQARVRKFIAGRVEPVQADRPTIAAAVTAVAEPSEPLRVSEAALSSAQWSPSSDESRASPAMTMRFILS